MPDSDTESLSSYIKVRGQIKAKLTKFKTFLNDTGKSDNITQLKLRMEKIKAIWDEFDKVQNIIELRDDIPEHLDYRDSFVDMYFEVMAQAEEKIIHAQCKKSEKIQGENSSESNPNENFPVVKLRPLEVPTFTGKFEEWASFQDMFSSLIHVNKSLTSIEKFYYLRNSLSGEACTLIQNLETSSLNYETAWTILKNRYNNNVAARIQKIKDLKLCENCLKNNHSADNCKARKCFKCQQPHNTLLHSEKKSLEQSNMNTLKVPVVSAHTASDKLAGQVLLATAVVKIVSAVGIYMPCRSLLDSGSQSNFITTQMVNILGLRRSKINIPVCGINGSKNIIKYKVVASIQSTSGTYNTTIELLVVPKITESVPFVPICGVQIPSNITLADPEFIHPGTIDLLIGADTYWELMRVRKFKYNIQGPYFQETALGWIDVGKTSENRQDNSHDTCLLAIQNENDELSLDEKIEKFWKLEEFTTKQHFNSEEKLCQEHFEKHVTRDYDGRFIVNLPFKEIQSQLGDSYKLALRRFLFLEQRLMRESNISIYNQYKQFMLEYENLGHMQCIGAIDTIDNNLIARNDCFYLPHTFVLNKNSLTTKLRVVFDGSAKSSSNLSLNDILMKGPKVQPDLFDIAVRFRTYKYAFSADIVKMYRQIMINKKDRNYQLIFWRANKNEN